MNYYCLIAGLPDLQLDQAKNLPSMETLLEELQGTLSASDAAWLRLLQMQYDNRNLLAYLADKNAPLHPLGTLTTADWAELMVLIDETDNPKDARLQPYMLTFLQAINDEKTRENIHSQEDFLADGYPAMLVTGRIYTRDGQPIFFSISAIADVYQQVFYAVSFSPENPTAVEYAEKTVRSLRLENGSSLPAAADPALMQDTAAAVPTAN